MKEVVAATEQSAGVPPDPVARAVAGLSAGLPQPWWVACSGGVDSMTLLHAASREALRRGVPLRVVHVDHGLQPESAEWARHVTAAAIARGAPCRVFRAGVKRQGSLEAAARQARYRCFEAVLADGGTLLLAHQRDDLVENVLLSFLRGRGGAELGIPESRRLGKGVVVRPFLQLERSVLEQFARREGLSWVTDPGNACLDVDRNHVRHVVLPALSERYALDTRLPSVAVRLAEDAELARTLGEIDLQRARRTDGSLALAPLLELDALRRRNVLRVWLAAEAGRQPSARQVVELERALRARDDARPAVRAAGVWVLRRGGALWIAPDH